MSFDEWANSERGKVFMIKICSNETLGGNLKLCSIMIKITFMSVDKGNNKKMIRYSAKKIWYIIIIHSYHLGTSDAIPYT